LSADDTFKQLVEEFLSQNNVDQTFEQQFRHFVSNIQQRYVWHERKRSRILRPKKLDTLEDVTTTIKDAIEISESIENPTVVDDSLKTYEDWKPDNFLLDASLEEPTNFLGEYIDLGIIGIGGMGVIHKVYDPTLKRTLAMKIIHHSILKNRNAVLRFIEEAQVGAQLQHPNIVPVHELGNLSDGRLYFTMKEIRGTELTELIREVHFVSPDKWQPTTDGTTFHHLIQIFFTICETVAYSHSLGVVHRDLKPENVMIGGFGEVLVVDWGIAKVIGKTATTVVDEYVKTDRSSGDIRATRMGTIAGTPAYMSPEQAEGLNDKIGPLSDVYALGAILYEILSGNPPFLGNSAMDVLELVKTSRPPSLKTISTFSSKTNHYKNERLNIPLLRVDEEKLPEVLIDICERAMCRQQDERYQSALDLAQDIQAWLEGAKRRDKAFLQLKRADQLLREIEDLDSRCAELRTQARIDINQNGINSNGWQLWHSAETLYRQVSNNRKQHIRYLQAALVHDPDLEEVHQELAVLIMDKLVLMSASGNREGVELHRQQWQHHIRFLSKDAQDQMQSLLKQKMNDVIANTSIIRGALIGREALLEQVISECNSGTRLISLIGTAGVGKTRLALEAVRCLKVSSVRSIFCDITEAEDELDILRILANNIGIRLSHEDPEKSILDELQQQPTLLLLDNAERLVGSVAKYVQHWLNVTEGLYIFVTSRLRLQIDTEYSINIEPLNLLEAMELFVRRGQQIHSGLQLDQSTIPTISNIVRRLDGLPLAIELAAARLSIISLQQIEERLNERFTLLRTRQDNVPTLEGALDWSWDLLQSYGQRTLAQVSIFHGGFSLSAAEQIVHLESNEEHPAMFDILEDLCDSSLLYKERTKSGDNRYQIMESIKVYSRAKLRRYDDIEECNEESTLQRHAQYFSQYGKTEFLNDLRESHSNPKWNTLFIELDNLVAAALNGGATGVKCCFAALTALNVTGPISLGIDIIDTVLETSTLSKTLSSRLLLLKCRYLRITGDLSQARKLVRESFFTIEQHLIPSTLKQTITYDDSLEYSIDVQGLISQGKQAYEQGKFASSRLYFQKALEVINNDANTENNIRLQLARVYVSERAYDLAAVHFKILLQRYESLSVKKNAIYEEMLQLQSYQGEYQKAIKGYNRLITESTDENNTIQLGMYQLQCGRILYLDGVLIEAENMLRIAIDNLQGENKYTAFAKDYLGETLLQLNRKKEAYNVTTNAIQDAQNTSDVTLVASIQSKLAVILCHLDKDDEAIELLERCETQLNSKSIAYADYLCCKAKVQLLRNQYIDSAQIFHQLDSLIQYLSLPNNNEINRKLVEMRILYRENIQGFTDSEEKSILEAERYIELGVIEIDESKYDKGIENYYMALSIYRACNDISGESEVLLALGNAHSVWGGFTKALSYFEAALYIFISLNNGWREVVCYGNLGGLYMKTGKYEMAVSFYKKALDIYRTYGHISSEAKMLGNLGQLYSKTTQVELAIPYLQQALLLHKDIGNKASQGRVHAHLGSLYMQMGEIEKSLYNYERAIEIAQSIGNQHNEAIFLGNMALVFLRQQRYKEALLTFEKAASINSEIGNIRSLGINFGNMGEVWYRMGEFDRAEQQFIKAIEICNRHVPPAAGSFQGILSLIYAERGQFDKALLALSTGEVQVKVEPNELGKFYCRKSMVYFYHKKYWEVDIYLRDSIRLRQSLKMNEESELSILINRMKNMMHSSVEWSKSVTAIAEEKLTLSQLKMEMSEWQDSIEILVELLPKYQLLSDREKISNIVEWIGLITMNMAREGNIEKAYIVIEHAFDECLEVNVVSGSLFCFLGKLQVLQGEIQEAIASMHKANNIAKELECSSGSQLVLLIKTLHNDIVQFSETE
jgi:serine/threonine protein kinase/tetratricopeptide (TPR) repeat protein